MSKKTNKRGGFGKRSKTLAKLRQNNGGMPGKVPLASQLEGEEEAKEEIERQREEEQRRLEEEQRRLEEEERQRQADLEEDRKVWERYKWEDEEARKDRIQAAKNIIKYDSTVKPEKPATWRTKVKDWWNNGAKQLKGGSQKRRRQNKRKSSKNRSR